MVILMIFYSKKYLLNHKFHFGIKKHHTYHFSTTTIKKSHANRFGIKNSYFFIGIIHGNKNPYYHKIILL